MARAKRRPKKRVKVLSKDESEDEHDVPDPAPEELFYDDVDKFHKNREKIFLQKSKVSSEEESNEDEQIEEVLGLDIDSDDDDEEESLEDDYINKRDSEDPMSEEKDEASSESDTEKGIPSEKAWGRKKKIYYDADDQKEKDIDSEEEEVLDKEEEEEALAMQERMAARLDEHDFDVEEFKFTGTESSEKKKTENDNSKQEIIIKDLSKLSKEEKLKLLAKDSPELFDLVNDFKEKLSDVMNRLQPLVQMARSGRITNQQGIDYLETKHQLTMNYLVNISFYLLLKAHQTSVKNHPVIERLVQYRELLDKLQPLDMQLHDDMEHFLKIYKADKENTAILVEKKKPKQKPLLARKDKSTKKVKFSKSEEMPKSAESSKILSNGACSKRTSKDVDPLSYYEAVKETKRRKKEERQNTHLLTQKAIMEDVGDVHVDGKRSITYQISKNKGLTPKRKKELRNPRIKHRRKYTKAKIKHKSQVLPNVKELSRYGGESTGIRTHLTRSIKIK